MALRGKRVLLCICGGIAAYKMADTASRLVKAGAEVKVLMTENALNFIAPLTFRTITGNEVFYDTFAPIKTWDVKHISLAEECDVCVVAPATANVIGKMANGIADDLLTTTVMAVTKPTVVFPAMNSNMYNNKANLYNISILKQRGITVIEPDCGRLACGTTGKGRLPEPEVICRYISSMTEADNSLQGKSVLVTAGPTVEYIDPVRYITNPSTGKMGFAVAAAARERGAEVTLISGPVNLTEPTGVKRVNVRTADEMYLEVSRRYSDADIIFFLAAVGDYKCKQISGTKIKKQSGNLTLELKQNVDIAYEMGAIKSHAIHFGACAETDDVETNALRKMDSKKFNLIMANDVTEKGAGFAGDTNIVTIYDDHGGKISLPLLSKKETADKMMDILTEYMKK